MSERMSEILAAACRVIARTGASGLRMSDVAEEARVSTPLVHYYFATRDELLARAFAYADGRLEARLTALCADAPSAAVRLDLLLTAHGDDDALLREEWLLWNEAWREAIFREEFRSCVLDPFRRWLERITEVLADGEADGSLRPRGDLAGVAERLAAVVDGLGQRLVVGDLAPARMRELIREAVARECDVAVGSAA